VESFAKHFHKSPDQLGLDEIRAPIFELGALGLAATRFPELLGSGRDRSQLLFIGAATLPVAAILLLLKPLTILAYVTIGVPGVCSLLH
jgi:H+/Cl- antiporter ClcA